MALCCHAIIGKQQQKRLQRVFFHHPSLYLHYDLKLVNASVSEKRLPSLGNGPIQFSIYLFLSVHKASTSTSKGLFLCCIYVLRYVLLTFDTSYKTWLSIGTFTAMRWFTTCWFHRYTTNNQCCLFLLSSVMSLLLFVSRSEMYLLFFYLNLTEISLCQALPLLTSIGSSSAVALQHTRLSFAWHTTHIMKLNHILHTASIHPLQMDSFGNAVFLMDSAADKINRGRGMPSSNLDFRPINLCCCWGAAIHTERKRVILVCKNLHAYREAENQRHRFGSTFPKLRLQHLKHAPGGGE